MKSFKYYFVVGLVIIGSVYWCVGGSVVGGSESEWSVVSWSVVGGFNKTR